jgi:hypothetical protein
MKMDLFVANQEYETVGFLIEGVVARSIRCSKATVYLQKAVSPYIPLIILDRISLTLNNDIIPHHSRTLRTFTPARVYLRAASLNRAEIQ